MKSVLVQKIVDTEYNCLKEIMEDKGRIYTFLNPVSYLAALEHKDLFIPFDGIFADGSLLVAAIKLLYGKMVKRRSFDMTSIAPMLFSYASDHGKSVYIVASRSENVEKAVEIFKDRYPKLNIVGYRHGYFRSGAEQEEEAMKITTLNPDFLIVGMGCLTQERFLLKVKDAGYQGIGFSCGGFVHQTSMNEIDYYWDWVNRLNLRFIYRICKEKHTRKRYWRAAWLFPIRFIRERFQ